ncbi:hypothetical protein [Bradyrhizobium sp. CCBAU 51745]|uniref:hypothetical protein n=1 Tax=Bradyrhizobium sp. CCBAU 51745 TaxID=1325099 RepID=UPI0023058D78|nr:hypothetical protein [Bradyrhizobium sp. CCBAU 51745]
MSNVNASNPRALAYDSARQRRFEYSRTQRGDEEIFRECASHSEALRRGPFAKCRQQIPKRPPLSTSVLFNHYSTNVADGDLSA